MKPLTKFSEIVVTLAENAAFVTALVAVPERYLHKEWLIIAHVIVLGCKAWYYKDKKTVSVEEPETPSNKLPEGVYSYTVTVLNGVQTEPEKSKEQIKKEALAKLTPAERKALLEQ